tara:strand:- start:366 stop:539 length:174 start_codon:yes stop_codon:yes gene_type:complete
MQPNVLNYLMGRTGFKGQFALLAANTCLSASSMFVLGLVAVKRANSRTSLSAIAKAG